MGCIVTLGKFMADKRALTTVKYYGGKLGNLLLTFASIPSPCAGNFGTPDARSLRSLAPTTAMRLYRYAGHVLPERRGVGVPPRGSSPNFDAAAWSVFMGVRSSSDGTYSL